MMENQSKTASIYFTVPPNIILHVILTAACCCLVEEAIKRSLLCDLTNMRELLWKTEKKL